VLYDAERLTTEENAQSFFVSKIRYDALINDTTQIMVGNQGRWQIVSRHSFFQSSMICNTHYLVLTLKKMDRAETVSYADRIVQFLKVNPIF